MIKNIIFSIVTLFLLTQRLILNVLPPEFQYLLWDSFNLICLVGVSFLLLTEIPYQKYIRKISAFLIFDISAYSLFDFIITTFAQAYELPFLKYLSVFLGLGVTAVFIRCYIKYFINKGDKYVRKSSYLVYTYPKSLWGILSSIYTAPYGHCFLVIDNKKFYYRRGGPLVEVPFVLSQQKKNLIFKRIPNVELEQARQLIGKKWSIFNNCFSTFRKFK